MKNLTMMDVIRAGAEKAPEMPKFPDAFGPRDMSNRTYRGTMKDVDLEVSRVIVRNRMRELAREVEAAAAEAHDEYLAGCGLCK